jgi:putative Mg2+ transporter-C (MgtC) family protein
MTSLTASEIALRMAMALLAGVVVGLERESRGRAAGLRTTVLACVAAALAMIISEILFIESAASGGAWRPDPARLGAGILTGIGFLGAGTIIRHAHIIRGVTTAASLWFVTVVGLAFGSGEFLPGFIGLGVALVALFLLPEVEHYIQSDWYATLTVMMETDALPEEQFRQRLKTMGLKMRTIELSYDLTKNQKIISCELRVKRPDVFNLASKVVTDLRSCPGVLQIRWT